VESSDRIEMRRNNDLEHDLNRAAACASTLQPLPQEGTGITGRDTLPGDVC